MEISQPILNFDYLYSLSEFSLFSKRVSSIVKEESDENLFEKRIIDTWD